MRGLELHTEGDLGLDRSSRADTPSNDSNQEFQIDDKLNCDDSVDAT